eukprot:101817-Amphidinium_carterae.2
MGLVDKRSKGSDITGSRTTGGNLPNSADLLEPDRVATSRSVAGIRWIRRWNHSMDEFKKNFKWLLHRQDCIAKAPIDIFVDADYAGDESRKSTDCLALSTGESEYYGLVRGSAGGLQNKHLLEEMGYIVTVDLCIHSDSSAARGVVDWGLVAGAPSLGVLLPEVCFYSQMHDVTKLYVKQGVIAWGIVVFDGFFSASPFVGAPV